jgi:hypothetical protein
MPGLIRGVARTAVIAGTATAVSNRVSRRQARRWADQEQQGYEQPDFAQPAPAPQTDMGGQIEQLKQLAELKDQGILSDQEFEAQKQKILGS